MWNNRVNRINHFALGLAGLTGIIPLSLGAWAQEIPVSAHTSSAAAALTGGTGARACSEADASGRTIEPYTATRKITMVQTLANGVTITHVSTGVEARDSSGRRYQKNQPEIAGGGDTQIPEFFFFNVYDPVSQTTTNWSSNSKEATVFHMMLHIPQGGKVQHTSSVAQPPLSNMPAFKPVQPKMQAENLGTKTIDGLEVTGARTTWTYPAGSIGNDQPLVVTDESWQSMELGIEVLRIDDDPRSGVRTTELTDIDRSEPDPALFQVPEGYTIKDQNPVE